MSSYVLQQLPDAYPAARIAAVLCGNGTTHHSSIDHDGSHGIPA